MSKRSANKGEASEAERMFGEALAMADPTVAEFVARHEALLERVAVLEKALERIVRADEELFCNFCEAAVIAREALDA